jgi:hypothetical protein
MTHTFPSSQRNSAHWNQFNSKILQLITEARDKIYSANTFLPTKEKLFSFQISKYFNEKSIVKLQQKSP